MSVIHLSVSCIVSLVQLTVQCCIQTVYCGFQFALQFVTFKLLNICGFLHHAFVVKIIPTLSGRHYAEQDSDYLQSTQPTQIGQLYCEQICYLSVPAYMWPYTAHVLLMMGGIVTRNM